MVRVTRYVYAALALAFVVALLLQVYFIGLGLFDSSEFKDLHITFGWILHEVPPFLLLAAAVAGAGRTRLLQTAALAVTIFFVPILAAVRADAPLTAAFHPVAAVLAILLAMVVARGATRLVRSSDEGTRTTVAEWVVVALLVVVYLVLTLSGSPEA
jgi:hypothetical protein